MGAASELQRRQQVFRTRDFHFEGGAQLQELRIAYWTAGRLNPAGDNVLFLCHGASGNRDWALPFCNVGGAFDATRWFIISADMPGGGHSSRSSTDPQFPAHYCVGDLSAATALLLEDLGVGPVRAFCGASMAGLIGLDLAYRRPDLVQGLALWVTGYRSDGFARAMAESLAGILKLDGGETGMRAAVGAFFPVLAGRKMIADMSPGALAALLNNVAREWSANWRAQELIARYSAVSSCDLASTHGGVASLAAGLKCPAAFLQSSSDMIFPPADAQALAALMPRGEVQTLSTQHGHVAPAAPPGSAEFSFFNNRTAAFLDALSS
ncbi:MAG: metX 2 [Gammaproteobacteria bacterium]|nr:metX 2 [Gammaproteobacteria bacterium]